MQNQPNQNEQFMNMKQLSEATGIGKSYLKRLRNEPGAPFIKLGTSRRADVIAKRSEFETWLKSYSEKLQTA